MSGLNPDVSTSRDLARRLGVSPSTITNWLTGSGGTTPSSMPDARIRDVCSLFGVDILTFVRTESPEQYEPLFSDNKKGLALLFGLSQLAPQAFEIVRVEDPSALGNRGVEFLGGRIDPGVEILPVGTCFRLRLQVPAGSHVILLLQDPDSVSCIDMRDMMLPGQTTTLSTECRIPDEKLKSFRTCRPEGNHCWLAIVARTPWPIDLLAELSAFESLRCASALTTLARELRKRQSKMEAGLSILRLPFYVKY
jgi:transcriptional regulator with XRE-family HTH domain